MSSLRELQRHAQRGAISTIGVLLAILVVGLSVGIGVQAMSYQTHMTMEGSNQMQSQSQVAMLETRLSRDAASAATVYYPSACSGSCDEIRFGKRNTDGSWYFWGYAAVASQQGIAYCTYSLSNSTRCTSPVIATGIKAFRTDVVQPSQITAAIGGALAAINPETYSKRIYVNSSDPYAAAPPNSNQVVVARFATARDRGEVHLVPGVIANNVAEVGNSTVAAPRGMQGGNAYNGFNFVQGTTLGPPYYTYPSQTSTFDIPRYNSSVTVGYSWPDNGSAQAAACSNVGTISGNVTNNPTFDASGVTAEVTVTATEANPGLCYFNVSMDHPNSNDTPTVANMYIDVYGPLIDSPTSVSFQNALETTSGVAGTQKSVAFSEANLVEGNQGGNLVPSAQTCNGIATYSTSGPGGYVANGTDSGTLYVNSVAPGSCYVDITGAWGTKVRVPITVGNYNAWTGNEPGNIVLASAASTSPTYFISEANDPNPIQFSRSISPATITSGGMCLYDSSNNCVAGLQIVSNANGYATYYVNGNNGTGLAGQVGYSISDGHGQAGPLLATVNANYPVGGRNFSYTNAGSGNLGNQNVSEAGYSGAFTFVRTYDNGAIGASNSMCLYTGSAYCNAGLYTANDGSGAAVYSVGAIATQPAGGTSYFNIKDSLGHTTGNYSVAVGAVGTLTAQTVDTIQTGPGGSTVKGPYTASESNDYAYITAVFNNPSGACTFSQAAGGTGTYSYKVAGVGSKSGGCSVVFSDGHGQSVTVNIDVEYTPAQCKPTCDLDLHRRLEHFFEGHASAGSRLERGERVLDGMPGYRGTGIA